MLDRLHDALRLRTSPTIFFGSALVIIALVVLTLVFTESMDAFFSEGSAWVIDQLGWFYILGVTVFLLFLVYLMAGRFGQVRLGPTTNAPSTRTWPGSPCSSRRGSGRS